MRAAGGLGMMSELRWALLFLGLVFIAALAWWELRRPRQARGPALERTPPGEPREETAAAAPREAPFVLPEVRARESLLSRELPVVAEAEVELPPVLAPGASRFFTRGTKRSARS